MSDFFGDSEAVMYNRRENALKIRRIQSKKEKKVPKLNIKIMVTNLKNTYCLYVKDGNNAKIA